MVEMNKVLLKKFQDMANNILRQQKQEEFNKKQKEKIALQNSIPQEFNRQMEIQQNKERNNMRNSGVFEKRLKDKQENFNSMMKGTRPNEIDFKDKIQDNPISSNQLDLTMSQRGKELAEIMKQQQKSRKAEDWINGGSNNRNTQNLKIDHESNISVEIDTIPNNSNQKNKKRVHFKIDELPKSDVKEPIDNFGNSFFNKLKMKKIDTNKNNKVEANNSFNNQAVDFLKLISENQIKILEEMKVMNEYLKKNLLVVKGIDNIESRVEEYVDDLNPI
jgi:hypothetical protein